jgi:hypothetical protein
MGLSVPVSQCTEFIITEKEVIDHYKKSVKDFDENKMRSRSSNFRLRWEYGTDEDGVFDDPDLGKVYGFTNCSESIIVLGKKNLRRSAFAHELLHVYENCADIDHENWNKNSFNSAIESFRY